MYVCTCTAYTCPGSVRVKHQIRQETAMFGLLVEIWRIGVRDVDRVG